MRAMSAIETNGGQGVEFVFMPPNIYHYGNMSIVKYVKK